MMGRESTRKELALSWWGFAFALTLAAAAIATGMLATGARAVAARTSIAAAIPHPDHVLIVMEENHAYSEIIGSAAAPYINSLAQAGAVFTNSHGVEHPSEPNYLDIFSGSNQGVTDDSCPHSFATANLGDELIAAGHSFAGYSEDLPAAGSLVCNSGAYARRHVPWANFPSLPDSTNQPFTAFPTDYTTLPTLSFVVPNVNDDMHDGTIAQGDTWLQNNISTYATWAQAHNSLLIVTWDEDDYSASNQIPTIFYGPMVVTGQYSELINHYNVLRTLEDMYSLPYAGASGNSAAITDVWTAGGTPSPTATPQTTPCPIQFADVPSSGAGSTYYVYARCLVCRGIVSGYACGGAGEPCNGNQDPYYRPSANVTRGQLSKIISNAAALSSIVPPGQQTFSDVTSSDPFWRYIERLSSTGAIGGYPCGQAPAGACDSQQRPYFLSSNNATRGQISKIVALAANIHDALPPDQQTFSDVPPSSPFWQYIEELAARNIISGYNDAQHCSASGSPCFLYNTLTTRGQMAKIAANTFYPNCQTTEATRR